MVTEAWYPEYLAYLIARAPIEDKPLPHDALPTTLLLSYVADSDSEEKPEEDPVNYLADGGDDADDDDDEEHEAFKDDDEEEEEHLAPTDSSSVPVVDLTSTARMPVRPQIPMSDTIEALIAEYASTPTLPSLPPSLLTPLSSPLPQIPLPPLPVPSLPLPLPSPPTHASPTYAEALLGYRPVEIWLRATSPSTHHLSEIPLLPLLLPSTTHRDDLPEADMPLWKRARFTTPTSRFEVGENSLAIVARVTDLAITQRQDAQELYVCCEDAWDNRALLGAQMISDKDSLTAHIQHEHDRFRELIGTTEAEPQDRPEDAGSSC
ncbi:hypothetical protein Tco_0447794 [Tanacetum coccineum]